VSCDMFYMCAGLPSGVLLLSCENLRGTRPRTATLSQGNVYLSFPIGSIKVCQRSSGRGRVISFCLLALALASARG